MYFLCILGHKLKVFQGILEGWKTSVSESIKIPDNYTESQKIDKQTTFFRKISEIQKMFRIEKKLQNKILES